MSRSRLLLSLDASLVVLLAACGGKVVFDGRGNEAETGSAGAGAAGATGSSDSVANASASAAAAGGASGDSTGPFSATSTSDGVGPSSGSGSSDCDTGSEQDPLAPICKSCQQCALASVCAAGLDTCQSNADCVAYYECYQECQCAECATNHPTGKQLYDQLLACLFCSCISDCGTTDPCDVGG